MMKPEAILVNDKVDELNKYLSNEWLIARADPTPSGMIYVLVKKPALETAKIVKK